MVASTSTINKCKTSDDELEKQWSVNPPLVVARHLNFFLSHVL